MNSMGTSWVLHPWIGSIKKNKSVEPKQSLLSQIVAYASRPLHTDAQMARRLFLNWLGLIQRPESRINHSLHNSRVGKPTYLNRYTYMLALCKVYLKWRGSVQRRQSFGSMLLFFFVEPVHGWSTHRIQFFF